ncbi:MAG: hypothetical protein ACRDY2_14130 [Acidimicrobiales bacterium]
MEYIEAKLKLTTSSVAENAKSGWMDETAIQFKYWSPSVVNKQVQDGLRMWVTGDPTRGLNWKVLAKHLRGLLPQKEYEDIGTLHYMLEDRDNVTNLVDTIPSGTKVQAARGLLDMMKTDVEGALDALPPHDGISYRQYSPANSSVYGGAINVGDYLRDAAFSATSALRISGSAGEWGQDGSTDHPKVYFIITGSSGRYISKYAQQEEGQHEVLFMDSVTFKVTKIANFRLETFFVHLAEVAAASLPLGQVIKNPYDGT